MANFPKLNELVNFEIKQQTELGMFVYLTDYNNIEAMVLYGLHWDKNVDTNKGRVIRIDEEKGYIDLSNKI